MRVLQRSAGTAGIPICFGIEVISGKAPGSFVEPGFFLPNVLPGPPNEAAYSRIYSSESEAEQR